MSRVTLDTTMGKVEVELYEEHAPLTCRNFKTLADRGYYDGTPFHRVIPDFMIQGGDPTGSGRGGTSIYDGGGSGDGAFPDEIHPDLAHAGAGILSMANSGPGSNKSGFFLTLAPTPWLDGKHTIFGRVRDGMDVVERMGLVATDGDDRPTQPLLIRSARSSALV